MSARRLLAVAAVVGLLGGCSGDDDAASGAVTGAPSTTPTTDATTVPTTVPSTTPTTVPPRTVPPTTVDVAAWCAVAAEVEAIDRLAPSPDPADVEVRVAARVEAIERAVAVAPPDLVDDVVLALDETRMVDAALADVGYDLLLVDLSVLDGELVEGSDAASLRIQRFNERECGISPVVDNGADDALVPSDGSLFDQFVDELVAQGFTSDEAECIFANLDFSDVEALDDEETVLDAIEACGITLERLAELEPVGPAAASLDELRSVLTDGGFLAAEADCVVEILATSTAGSAAEFNADLYAALLACGFDDERLRELDPDGTAFRRGFVDRLIDDGLDPAAAECVADGIDLTDPAAASDPVTYAEAFRDCGVELPPPSEDDR